VSVMSRVWVSQSGPGSTHKGTAIIPHKKHSHEALWHPKTKTVHWLIQTSESMSSCADASRSIHLMHHVDINRQPDALTNRHCQSQKTVSPVTVILKTQMLFLAHGTRAFGYLRTNTEFFLHTHTEFHKCICLFICQSALCMGRTDIPVHICVSTIEWQSVMCVNRVTDLGHLNINSKNVYEPEHICVSLSLYCALMAPSLSLYCALLYFYSDRLGACHCVHIPVHICVSSQHW